MVDDRRRSIINWTGSLHASFIYLTHKHSQLIDFIITTHPSYQELVKLGQEQKKNIHTGIYYPCLKLLHSSKTIQLFSAFFLFLSLVLEERLEKLRVENGVESLTELIKDLHVYPDFHGTHVFYLS
jgi:hypothetical protein